MRISNITYKKGNTGKSGSATVVPKMKIPIKYRK